MSRRWNRDDGIISLLCLEDAYDDLGNSLLPGVYAPVQAGGIPDPFKVPLLRHVHQRFHVIDSSLEVICMLGRLGPRTIQRIPRLQISIAILDSPQELREFCRSLVSNGTIAAQDGAIPGEARLMGKYTLGWVIRIEGGKGTNEEKVIDEILDVTDVVTKYFVHLTAIRIRASLTATAGETVPLVNYPSSMVPEAIMQAERVGPRKMFASNVSPAEWTSSFSEALGSSLPTIVFGIDSASSRQAMKRETDELFKGFDAYPGYGDLFRKEFGYSFSAFRTVTTALQTLSVPRIHHIYIDTLEKILRRAAKLAQVPTSEARRIIESLVWTRGKPVGNFPLLPVHAGYAFSLFRMRREVVSRIEGCFQLYDNNVKGEKFEGSCRGTLRDQGSVVHPERLELADQVLSDEDSYRIWGKIKKGTDFDVLGTKGIYLLVLECKERNPSMSQLTHVKNMTVRYSEEHSLKCKWLAANIERLSGSPCVTPPLLPEFIRFPTSSKTSHLNSRKGIE